MITIKNIVHLKFAKTVDLKCSHHTHIHTHTKLLCEVMDVLINLIVVIIVTHCITVYMHIKSSYCAPLKITLYSRNWHSSIKQLYSNKKYYILQPKYIEFLSIIPQ